MQINIVCPKCGALIPEPLELDKLEMCVSVDGMKTVSAQATMKCKKCGETFQFPRMEYIKDHEK